MMFWEKKQGKKETHQAREEFFSKLNELKRTQDIASYSAGFFKLARTFFAKAFLINYAFTYEELNKEIDKKKLDESFKERLTLFANKLSLIEYGEAKLSRNELLSLTGELEQIVRNFIELGEFKGKKEKSVKKKAKKPQTKKISWALPQNLVEWLRGLLNFRQRNTLKMNKLMLQAYSAVEKGDLIQATKLYLAISRLFDRLPEEEKRMNYARILKLCYRIEQFAKN